MKIEKTIFSGVIAVAVLTGCQTSKSIKNIQSSHWMVCANDQLYSEAGGAKHYFENPGAGSLTIMDVSSVPPQSVSRLEDVPCSLIGPPTCVAVTPDQRVALVAGAMKAAPGKPEETIPNDQLSVVRLMPGPAEVVQKLTLGQQPSGVEISRDGRRALITNRADGTVSLLSLAPDGRVGLIGTFKVAEPQSSVSHAAISPDGNRAMITLTKEKSVLFCSLANDRIEVLQKVQGGDGPYGVEFLPDGTGAVAANVYDGTLTVFRISGDEIDVIDTIPAGIVPEGLDISPDGQWLVVNCLENTNITPDRPAHRETAMVLLFQKQKKTFVLMDVIRVDPIPQSAVFTPDGCYVAVASNADQSIRFYKLAGHQLFETGIKINCVGGPAAMRISM